MSTTTINGHTLAYWSETLGVSINTLRWRVARGYPVDKILTSEKFRPPSQEIQYHGKIYTVVELEKMSGINRRTIQARARAGLADDELLAPVHHRDGYRKKSEMEWEI